MLLHKKKKKEETKITSIAADGNFKIISTETVEKVIVALEGTGCPKILKRSFISQSKHTIEKAIHCSV